jgi:hypothetical protein
MPRRYASALHAKCMIDASRPIRRRRKLKIDFAKKREENSNHA